MFYKNFPKRDDELFWKVWIPCDLLVYFSRESGKWRLAVWFSRKQLTQIFEGRRHAGWNFILILNLLAVALVFRNSTDVLLRLHFVGMAPLCLKWKLSMGALLIWVKLPVPLVDDRGCWGLLFVWMKNLVFKLFDDPLCGMKNGDMI